jgi:hypothetical protein
MKKILIAPLLIFMIASCHKEQLSVLRSANNNLLPRQDTTHPTSFPTVSGAAGVFYFLNQASYPVRGYTTSSRYILYDNGKFALQYGAYSGLEYRGSYTKVDSLITFNWEGWSTAGPWGATGRLKGDTLTVAFNIIMELSDFEDAVYLREP